MMTGAGEGITEIERGVAIATAQGDDRLVALGHMQIGSGMGELRQYAVAVPALSRGIAWSADHDLVTSEWYCTAWLARCDLEQGRWDQAAGAAAGLVRTPRCVGIARIVALVTLGSVRARRGDPDAGDLLDEAVELARRSAHLQRLWPVAASRAEAAWLAGRPAAELDLVDEVLGMALDLDYARAVEELAFWRRLGAGGAGTSPWSGCSPTGRAPGAEPVTPFGMALRGDAGAAADGWAQVGCPYEQAMAMLLAGERESLTAAFAIAGRLGALPLRARAAAALRAGGWPVPRGPVNATAANPAGLTERQLDVLALLATGATEPGDR